LTASFEHPAAVVKRQQERDVAILLPSIQHLTERQYQLFFLFQNVVLQHRPEGFVRLADEDVAEAAAAAAATLETSARGVIYEHRAPSVIAQRLAGELATMIEEIRGHGATVYDREAAVVLRAIEQGVRDASRASGGEPTAYLTLVGRLLQAHRAAGPEKPSAPSPSPILLP
jgi:hypothetical protein